MTHDPNPRYRLAPRTSSQRCVPSTLNRLKGTFQSTPNRLDCAGLVQMPNPFHFAGENLRTYQHSAKP
jgi:hypothetical protein